jgi:hypothetical protein
MDQRDASVTYVDMSDRKVWGSGTICAGMDFSPVDGLVSGRLAGDTLHRYLVALTVKDVVIYRFEGFGPYETLRKQVWVLERASTVTGVMMSAADQVSLLTRDGTTLPVQAP